jgi:biopolymer transport protein ExbD
MAGEVVERQKKGGKKGLRRPKRRISIRIDMTPMVDIAFLLLIFYMVTTVFAMPQAMEINLPPADENKDIEVAESHLLTIRVDEDGRFWWNMKTPTPENLPQLLPSAALKPTDTASYKFNPDTLQGLLVALNRKDDRLNTLILINRKAPYNDMVNILDEIDQIERSWNAYTAKQQGVKVDQLQKKFSYRYAIGEWEDRDTKIMQAAVQQAHERGEL